jgi:endonuclease/exonuclease/phosphatase family metal-dependent hydrolase
VSLRLGLADPDAVVRLVRERDVDVLVVQELTPRIRERLCRAGIEELLPSGHAIPARPGSPPAGAGGVWTRLPVVGCGTVAGGFEQPTLCVRVGDGPDVEVTAVHTTPPRMPTTVRAWAADLAALPSPDPSVLRVLAGDFNATLDHAALRAVLARGYRDAGRAAGRGLAATWGPLRPGVPVLTLDHVLVDPRVGVGEVAFAQVAGSDHRAVVVDLRLPG